MIHFVENSIFFGVVVSILAYGIGTFLRKKFKLALFNPLLVSIVITIFILVVLNIDYGTYYEGAKYISYLLTPATICLAIPLYEQFHLLKSNWKAILSGILAGSFTSLLSILSMALLFQLDYKQYVTLLPKSITTAIGIGISEELGGYVSITAAVIIITGVLGNILAESILKLCKITEPVARGVAIGTSSHAIGTAKAMELGEVEGAMSSLSIVVAGIVTVAGAWVFAQIT